MRPYKEVLENNISYRVFTQSTPEEEFVWHRDQEDRSINLLQEETDWMFQYDNELPIKITSGSTLFVPKDMYHRLIKGTGDLHLKITKYI